MIIIQERVPILGQPELWQVLIEYEHSEREPVQLTGFRLNWLTGAMPEVGPGKVPVEILYRGAFERRVIYENAEHMSTWWNRERYLNTYFMLEMGDLIQLRAKFPCPVDLAHVVLF